jgi:hypothetical protein
VTSASDLFGIGDFLDKSTLLLFVDDLVVCFQLFGSVASRRTVERVRPFAIASVIRFPRQLSIIVSIFKAN